MNFAQSVFAPVGSCWTYDYISHNGAYTGLKTLYYNSDTTINSTVYKRLCYSLYYHCVCPDPPIYQSGCMEYVLERNDSIFQYYPIEDSLQLLYAFNSNVGDSIVLNDFSPGFRYKIVLDSIGNNFICGANRQVLYYTKYMQTCTEPMAVVEGIGPIDNYLLAQGIGNCEMGMGTFYFNCVNIVTDTYPSGNCANQPFGIKENATLKYALTNTSNGIAIEFSEPLNGTIIISNILGGVEHREQLDDQSSFEFNTGQLAKGIYLFSIDGNSGVNLSGKFIVE